MVYEIVIRDAFIIAMVIQAINAAFWEGMILGKVGGWLELKSENLYKMLVGCPICMVPWHSLWLCWFFGLTWWAIPVAMGINTVVLRWEKAMDDD